MFLFIYFAVLGFVYNFIRCTAIVANKYNNFEVFFHDDKSPYRYSVIQKNGSITGTPVGHYYNEGVVLVHVVYTLCKAKGLLSSVLENGHNTVE